MGKRRSDPNDSLDWALVNEGRRHLLALAVITRRMDEWSNENMVITKIVLDGPEVTGGGFRAVIKAIDEARNPFVAFRSGGDVKEVLSKIAADTESGRLIFKEETPWKPTKA